MTKGIMVFPFIWIIHSYLMIFNLLSDLELKLFAEKHFTTNDKLFSFMKEMEDHEPLN